MRKADEVTLLAYSEIGPVDKSGNFSYCENPLSHYHDSKMCKVAYEWGGARSVGGVKSITVETTLSFIKMMGWEKDLEYKVNKEHNV